jgi:signal transduction histidine kinase
VRRREQDPDLGELAADGARGVDDLGGVGRRHADVRDDEVGRPGADRLDQRRGVADAAGHVVAGLAEEAGDPLALSRSGLGPSLRALARRSPVPVSIEAARVGRLPEPTETAVYYVVSEALANAAKHSRASKVTVIVISDATGVRATIADDGVGGAAPARGSGLIGLVDRVEALGGKLTLESPPGRGTTISIELPGAGR